MVERGDVHRATAMQELVDLVVGHADQVASLGRHEPNFLQGVDRLEQFGRDRAVDVLRCFFDGPRCRTVPRRGRRGRAVRPRRRGPTGRPSCRGGHERVPHPARRRPTDAAHQPHRRLVGRRATAAAARDPETPTNPSGPTADASSSTRSASATAAPRPAMGTSTASTSACSNRRTKPCPHRARRRRAPRRRPAAAAPRRSGRASRARRSWRRRAGRRPSSAGRVVGDLVPPATPRRSGRST